MTLSDFIAYAKEQLSGIYDPRERDNVIHLVVEELLEIPRHKINLQLGVILDEDFTERLSEVVKRLASNEPVQYVLGSADFFGMKLKVNKHVLIPRPETEELVGYAIKMLRPLSENKDVSILDIGTGSGCIAVALKKHVKNCKVTSIDISTDALNVARENAKAENCGVNFQEVDFLNKIKWDQFDSFDAIISNPPYVTNDEFSDMMPRVRDFEPHLALIANGGDPFVFYKKIATFGKSNLRQNGIIFLEMNGAHCNAIEAIFKKASYNTTIINDLQGAERILVAGN